jgi:hypothetical protein
MYQFSRDDPWRDWKFSELYPSWQEIREYFHYVDKKLTDGLTAAGRAFLDHARIALAQAEAVMEAARMGAHPAKPTFALGFLTGQEMDWLPEAIKFSSQLGNQSAAHRRPADH